VIAACAIAVAVVVAAAAKWWPLDEEGGGAAQVEEYPNWPPASDTRSSGRVTSTIINTTWNVEHCVSVGSATSADEYYARIDDDNEDYSVEDGVVLCPQTYLSSRQWQRQVKFV
jgi:hypothetical protein